MFFAFSGYGQSQNGTGLIFGQLQLDSTWNKTIYLSHIPDFKKMYTMSRSMMIAESAIDSTGYFEIDIDFLPEDNNLYRLHIAKRNSVEASIVIGGEAENHVFLIANKNTVLEIGNRQSVFSEVAVIQDDKNKVMREVDNIVKLIDSTNYHSSKVKGDFVERAFNEQLRQIADTCKYPLVSLYALHKSQYESDIKTNSEFYQNFINKWHKETSPYFEVFRSKIPKPKSAPNNSIYYLFGLLMAFASGYFLRQLSSRKSKNEKLLQTLSIQERKIFELLQQGKSNKEISEELNVGISTVKSHVSSIYSKLGLKSRKEVLNFQS